MSASSGVARRRRAGDGARAVALTLLIPWVCAVIACVAGAVPAAAEEERAEGFFSLVDESGRCVFQTAIVLTAGDVFIDSDNRAYEVFKVSGDRAFAKFREVVTLGWSGVDEQSLTPIATIQDPTQPQARAQAQAAAQGPPQAAPRARGPVVVYHTHSDESYVPSSGTASKPVGDVYRVGKSFSAELESYGWEVIMSEENHSPHDGAAYHRSRRTAAQLLRKRPVAIFDIHRDAVPAGAYADRIRGESVTRVTMVVGRQNQTRGANVAFAKRLKAAADSRYPGLVKGILWAQGNYNQDLYPRSVLVEVGAHTNPLPAAMRGAGLFADAVAAELARIPARPGGLAPGSPWRTVLWVAGIGVVAAAAYLLINEGSWEGVKRRVMHFFGAELGAGRRPKP